MHAPEDTNDALLLDAWRAEEAVVPEGWDFGPLDGRVHEEDPPWDFSSACRAAIMTATRVLDLGTGGGEQLLTFVDVLPPGTLATEGWEPNVPVATEALSPHGISVHRYDSEGVPRVPLPFEGGCVDLVIARHESFDAAEVARVLRPGGTFLTQQVGGDDAAELHVLFGAPFAYPEVLLPQVASSVAAAGLVVEESASWAGRARFDDVGALVRYLRIVPWDVPDDFGVDRYARVLLDLHRRGPARGEPVLITPTRFWLRARKPLHG